MSAKDVTVVIVIVLVITGVALGLILIEQAKAIETVGEAAQKYPEWRHQEFIRTVD